MSFLDWYWFGVLAAQNWCCDILLEDWRDPVASFLGALPGF